MKRSGATIIEVLLTLSLISILSAILLPAIQSAREVARRLECAAKLAELSKACTEYESSRGHFPGSYLRKGFNTSVPKEHRTVLSVWVELLPLLDQVALYDEIDRSEIGYLGLAIPPGNIKNIHHIHTALPILSCPSDKLPNGWCSYRSCRGSHFTGIQRRHTAGALNGGMRDYPPVMSGLQDGASQTVMFSERIVGDANPEAIHSSRDVAVFPYLQTPNNSSLSYPVDDYLQFCRNNSFNSTLSQSYGGSTWILNGYLFTWYNHAVPPNWSSQDCGRDYTLDGGTIGARSMHPGGVNAAMADGSVRFFSDAINLSVWRALGTRAGGETLE